MSYSTRLALPAIIPTNGPFHCSFSRGRQGPLHEPARAKCSVLGNDTFVDVDISFLVNLSLPKRLFIDILLDLVTIINVIVNDTENVNNKYNKNNNNNKNTNNVDITAHSAKPFRFWFSDAFAEDDTGAKEEERTRDHRMNSNGQLIE